MASVTSTAKRAWVAAMVITATSPALTVASGESVYQGTCIACHGAGGEGTLPGVSDLSESNGPLTKSDDELKRNIVNGFRSPGSPLTMPPKGGDPSLSDEDIDAVIRYMRETFGSH